MVIGTNSMPTVIPNLEYGEKGKFIQCKQLNYVTTPGYHNNSVVLQLNYEEVQTVEQHSCEAALG